MVATPQLVTRYCCTSHITRRQKKKGSWHMSLAIYSTWMMGGCGSADHVYYHLCHYVCERLQPWKSPETLKKRKMFYFCKMVGRVHAIKEVSTTIKQNDGQKLLVSSSTIRIEELYRTYRNCRVSAHCHQHGDHLVESNPEFPESQQDEPR